MLVKKGIGRTDTFWERTRGIAYLRYLLYGLLQLFLVAGLLGWVVAILMVFLITGRLWIAIPLNIMLDLDVISGFLTALIIPLLESDMRWKNNERMCFDAVAQKA